MKYLPLSKHSTFEIICCVVSSLCMLGCLTRTLPATADEPKTIAPLTRTRAEVEELIKTVGRTPPDWLASTPLNYPKTLDLTWTDPKGDWNNQKFLGSFLWDVVNPNPHRWREGVKLMHLVVSQNRDNKLIMHRAADALGHLYGECLEDVPRAAFWWRLSGENDLELANCYWKLGCREMAEEILNGYDVDRTRSAFIIKLWAEMGDVDKALQMAEAKAKNGAPDSAYLAAGDACRRIGRYQAALEYYEKAAAAKEGSGRLQKNLTRAQASIVAIKTFDSFDPTRVPDGSYTSESRGYEGPIQVRVDVKQGRIEAVKIVQHREKQFYSALTDTPRQIISKQAVKGVDATSGATITSEAIINATAKALAGKK